MEDQLVGVSAAAQITGMLPQTIRARANRGEIRVAARDPLRFRLSTILRYKTSAPPLKIGRPRDAVLAARRLDRSLAHLTQGDLSCR